MKLMVCENESVALIVLARLEGEGFHPAPLDIHFFAGGLIEQLFIDVPEQEAADVRALLCELGYEKWLLT